MATTKTVTRTIVISGDADWVDLVWNKSLVKRATDHYDTPSGKVTCTRLEVREED